ncbi:hypothetical protein B447_04898 [Thauera sp. 27]|nr:hypothetical protein B447_04898 [Thauera sp. 27]
MADAAKENGRSLNSEITARLAASFEQPEIPALKIAEKYGLGGKAFIDAVAAAVSEVVLQKIDEEMRPFADVVDDEDGSTLKLSGPAAEWLRRKAERTNVSPEKLLRDLMSAPLTPDDLEITKHRRAKNRPDP